MSTYVAGFQSFLLAFLHDFVLAKLATSSLTVKRLPMDHVKYYCFTGNHRGNKTICTCLCRYSTRLLKAYPHYAIHYISKSFHIV